MSSPADNAFVTSVPRIMHGVRSLSGALKSQALTLLAEQMEQAGYNLLSQGGRGGDDPHLALARYVQIARGCIHEMSYQVLRAREEGLPDRRPFGPVQCEFLEIRRMLAGFLRGARRQTRARI